MRTNDITLLIFTFLLGALMGVIATASIYSAAGKGLSEAERQDAEDALKKAQDERDDALARIEAYLEEEKVRQLDLAQPGSGDASARRAEADAPKRADVASAPAPEPLPAPREEPTDAARSAMSLGFGAPRQNGKN